MNPLTSTSLGTGIYLLGPGANPHDIREWVFHPTPEWLGPSLIFYCPKCGKVWAKACSGNDTQWQSVALSCEDCPTWISQPAGSLFIDWKPEFTATFPQSILLREFTLWAKFVKEL